MLWCNRLCGKSPQEDFVGLQRSAETAGILQIIDWRRWRGNWAEPDLTTDRNWLFVNEERYLSVTSDKITGNQFIAQT